MKEFDIKEFQQNPNLTLVLQHYKEPFEYWLVKDSLVVMDKELAIRVPDTGYNTSDVVLADGSDIRDMDNNLVGTLKLAEPGEFLQMSIDTLAQLVIAMNFGDSHYFSCDDDSDHWGVTKLRLFDGNCIIVGCCGGGDTQLYDLDHGGNIHEITDFLKRALEDHTTDFIYWEVPRIAPEEEESHEVFLLYSTDAWHSRASRELIAVFSDREKLDEYIEAMGEEFNLSGNDIAMLLNQDQTQSREVNYLIESETMNPQAN